MCYYERDDYLCGDWKWGNMRQRCERQPRTGETCGAKLVAEEYRNRRGEDCRVCRDILTKRGRLQREQANIARWKKDGRKFEASIEKAERESRQLEDTLRELYQRRPSYQFSKGGQGPRHDPVDPRNRTASDRPVDRHADRHSGKVYQQTVPAYSSGNRHR